MEQKAAQAAQTAHVERQHWSQPPKDKWQDRKKESLTLFNDTGATPSVARLGHRAAPPHRNHEYVVSDDSAEGAEDAEDADADDKDAAAAFRKEAMLLEKRREKTALDVARTRQRLASLGIVYNPAKSPGDPAAAAAVAAASPATQCQQAASALHQALTSALTLWTGLQDSAASADARDYLQRELVASAQRLNSALPFSAGHAPQLCGGCRTDSVVAAMANLHAALSGLGLHQTRYSADTPSAEPAQ